MATQLFVYYRIPKAEIDLGLACAGELIRSLKEHNLGRAKLYQREESDKPYFTLMEVVEPEPSHFQHFDDFNVKVQELARQCFSAFETPPARHTEVFAEVPDSAFKPCA